MQLHQLGAEGKAEGQAGRLGLMLGTSLLYPCSQRSGQVFGMDPPCLGICVCIFPSAQVRLMQACPSLETQVEVCRHL